MYQVGFKDLNKFGTVQSNPLKTEINSPTKYILEESIFDFRYVRLCDIAIPKKNDCIFYKQWRGEPNQTPHSAASDLSLHCLPVTHLGVSSLQWVLSVLEKK